MSYLIWWIIGGRDRYPQGVSWFLLSLIRLLDWAAFIGLTLFLTVQVAGLAVDARSYMHYKTLQNNYEYDIAEVIEPPVSSHPDAEEQKAKDATFLNYRQTEKQKALFGWYGKLLVLEETAWDNWRSLFNYETLIWDQYSLIPFFWLNGSDNSSNSMSELDGYYTFLGIDGRAATWEQDRLDLYGMINLYNTSNRGYMQNVLKETNAPQEKWDKFNSCTEMGSTYRVSHAMRQMSYTREDSTYFKKVAQNFNKERENLNNATKCVYDLQEELGVKHYPTEEMLDYNEKVLNYKSAVLSDAINRAQSDEATGNSKGVPLYNTYNLDWETRLYRKYILNCELECNEAQIPEDWDKNYVRGALKVTPFYDVVVEENTAYK